MYYTVLALFGKWSLLNQLQLLEIQHTAHTMDSYDPDLQAFESDFCAIIWAREIVKNVALVSNLSQDNNQATTTLNKNPNVEHHLIAYISQSDSDNALNDLETFTE